LGSQTITSARVARNTRVEIASVGINADHSPMEDRPDSSGESVMVSRGEPRAMR